jgi:hypothetical protein
MSLLAPDILQEARQLSIAITATGLAMGLFLWLFGWRGHRFWIVLATTVSAGILGLQAGPNLGTQPLVAGLLLAVAAGVLALALVRVVAFIAGGVAAWMLVQGLAPTYHEPLVCFLVGGLLGLLLFRVWTMALTSFAGALLVVYCSLGLADRLGKLDAVAIAEGRPGLLNWVCGGLTLAGLLMQFLLERRKGKGTGEKNRNRPRSGPPRRRDEGGGESTSPWFGLSLDSLRRAG